MANAVRTDRNIMLSFTIASYSVSDKGDFIFLPKQGDRTSPLHLPELIFHMINYRIKLVLILSSAVGTATPFFFPASIHFNSHAMFFPRTRMI